MFLDWQMSNGLPIMLVIRTGNTSKSFQHDRVRISYHFHYHHHRRDNMLDGCGLRACGGP